MDILGYYPPSNAGINVPVSNSTSPKRYWLRLLILLAVLLVIVAIFLALYYGVFNKHSSTNSNENYNNTIVPPADGAYQAYGGSGGLCEFDTDCPVVTINERIADTTESVLMTYTQYCDKGVCVTNKPCSTNKDCIPTNVPAELSDCDPLSETPCRYTAGCVNGYCQRLRCQNNVNCGLFEACTQNELESETFGYCIPLGNKCNNTQTFGSSNYNNGSVECWGGYFPCTGSLSGEVGYCTQCYAGSSLGDVCNMTDNINTGPGSVCTTIDDFPYDSTIKSNTPANCRVVDRLKYLGCPAGYVSVISSNAAVCCEATTGGGKCNQACKDDYQCDDKCPFCVAGICSCVQVSPFSLWRNRLTATFPCTGGIGKSGNSTTGDIDLNSITEITDDIHVCVTSESTNTTAAFNYNPFGINGDMNCSLDKPYYIIATGKCSDKLDGAACSYDIGSNAGYCSTSNGEISIEYVCSITGTCRKGKLQAGEKCGVVPQQSCDAGLVCANRFDDTINAYKRICIPEP